MTDLPNTDPAFFFRRVWSGSTPMDTVTTFRRQDDGTLLVTMDVPHSDLPPAERALEVLPIAPPGLVIYGRAVVPRTEHDQDYAARMRERGQVYSECYSINCVEGECGTHPLAAVSEITAEEFEAARIGGWS